MLVNSKHNAYDWRRAFIVLLFSFVWVLINKRYAVFFKNILRVLRCVKSKNVLRFILFQRPFYVQYSYFRRYGGNDQSASLLFTRLFGPSGTEQPSN